MYERSIKRPSEGLQIIEYEKVYLWNRSLIIWKASRHLFQVNLGSKKRIGCPYSKMRHSLSSEYFATREGVFRFVFSLSRRCIGKRSVGAKRMI